MPPRVHPAAVLVQTIDGTHVNSISRPSLRILLLRGRPLSGESSYQSFRRLSTALFALWHNLPAPPAVLGGEVAIGQAVTDVDQHLPSRSRSVDRSGSGSATSARCRLSWRRRRGEASASPAQPVPGRAHH